jgi:hypothetical protein
MEIIKYLCEFFFGNFWHFLGLIVFTYFFMGFAHRAVFWSNIKPILKNKT